MMNQKAIEIEAMMEKMGREDSLTAFETAREIVAVMADEETSEGLTYMRREGECLVFETGNTELPMQVLVTGPLGKVVARADNPSTFVMVLYFSCYSIGIPAFEACKMLVGMSGQFKELCKGFKGENA